MMKNESSGMANYLLDTYENEGMGFQGLEACLVSPFRILMSCIQIKHFEWIPTPLQPFIYKTH